MKVNGPNGPLTEGEPDGTLRAVGGQATSREAALLSACGGDPDQLDRVRALLDKRPASTPLPDALPTPHTRRSDAELALLMVPMPPRPRVRVKPAPVVAAVEASPKVAKPVPSRSCSECVGKRATRLAESVRDVEENPGDFRCTNCGRLFDSPQPAGKVG